MNPVPPPNDSANYPRNNMYPGPYQPFKGDKIYVAIDVLMMIVGFGTVFALIPMITEQSIQKQAASGGPKVDPAMIQNVMLGFLGCGVIVCLPISILLWVYLIKGKTWAFIVSLVLAVLGLLNGIISLATNPIIILGLFPLVTSLARIIYLGARIGGKIGPKPM